MSLRRLRRFGDSTLDLHDYLRAYLRSLERQRAPVRPGYALAAGLATLVTVFVL